jgi:hypothetical protein
MAGMHHQGGIALAVFVLLGASTSAGCSDGVGSGDSTIVATTAAVAEIATDIPEDPARVFLGDLASQQAVDSANDHFRKYFEAWAGLTETERSTACESTVAMTQLAESMTSAELEDSSTMEQVIAYQCDS